VSWGIIIEPYFSKSYRCRRQNTLSLCNIFVSATKVYLFKPIKLKVINSAVVVRVEISSVADVASAAPVGLLVVP